MLVLGLETSCDETAIALYEGGRGLLAHTLHSQVLLHAEYGGIVPELASRDHIAKILPLLEEALRQAQRPRSAIQGIAYTAGPGLIGALLVGATFAKGLGYALNVPTVAIHHMEGHLLASLLEKPMPDFPFIALLVSGGHTLLVEVRGLGQYQLLGESLDDAAGEAFDKTAKLLGLQYPGGPVLAELAKSGQPGRFHFPRPLTEKPGLDFSFSGLKTFTLYTFQNTDKSAQDKADIAYEFQDAITDTLVIKCQRALQHTGLQRLVVAGGVGANLVLRDKLQALSQKLSCQVYFPRVEFCTDNAAMIAFAGYLRLQRPVQSSLEIKVQPRWHMDTLKE